MKKFILPAAALAVSAVVVLLTGEPASAAEAGRYLLGSRF